MSDMLLCWHQTKMFTNFEARPRCEHDVNKIWCCRLRAEVTVNTFHPTFVWKSCLRQQNCSGRAWGSYRILQPHFTVGNRLKAYSGQVRSGQINQSDLAFISVYDNIDIYMHNSLDGISEILGMSIPCTRLLCLRLHPESTRTTLPQSSGLHSVKRQNERQKQIKCEN